METNKNKINVTPNPSLSSRILSISLDSENSRRVSQSQDYSTMNVSIEVTKRGHITLHVLSEKLLLRRISIVCNSNILCETFITLMGSYFLYVKGGFGVSKTNK